MSVVKLMISEVVGLFLDDEFMAVAVLVLISCLALIEFAMHLPALLVGAILLVGCVLVLMASTLRGMRRH